MEENLANSDFFKDWERKSIIEVDMVFYGVLGWHGSFDSSESAIKEMDKIIPVYISHMEDRLRRDYGKKRKIYIQEENGYTQNIFSDNPKKKRCFIKYVCIRQRGGYVNHDSTSTPMKCVIEFNVLENTPCKDMGNMIVYLKNNNAQSNDIFGNCKNRFFPNGFCDSVVDAYENGRQDIRVLEQVL